MESLLCAVFERFERKTSNVSLSLQQNFEPDAFAETLTIHNDAAKADRVWKGLQKKLDGGWMRKFYCCFLSEKAAAIYSLFEFTCYIFSNEIGAEKNYGNEHVLAVAQVAKKVEREKHRMEAFIRFKHSSDGIFYCGIDPDFNVIPLIMKHFKDRYADQKWIIYDLKRHYGLFYDLEKVAEIKLDYAPVAKSSPMDLPSDVLQEKQELYALLWNDYFKSTNIPARKNMKLHLQHVPKRYWKYLTEKK